MTTHRILCNIDHASVDGKRPWKGWTMHFIDADGRTRIGPWLLLEWDEVLDILRWGNAESMDDFHRRISAWHRSSVGLHLQEAQRRALIERGRIWPWNGYQLTRMLEAGQYPSRLPLHRGPRLLPAPSASA